TAATVRAVLTLALALALGHHPPADRGRLAAPRLWAAGPGGVSTAAPTGRRGCRSPPADDAGVGQSSIVGWWWLATDTLLNALISTIVHSSAASCSSEKCSAAAARAAIRSSESSSRVSASARRSAARSGSPKSS